MKIRYFDISWVSSWDGPGRRVVLFLQGCHLRCSWCHSPHSWETYCSILFFGNRCLLCGRCAEVCQNGVHLITTEEHHVNHSRCIRCGACVAACPVSSDASKGGPLVLPTKEVDVEEAFDLLEPQLRLMQKVGGITLSGGEALLQLDAVKEILVLCRSAGFHTVVETSGTLPRKNYKEVSDLVDCWLFGLRPVSSQSMVPPDSFSQACENLRFLSSSSDDIIIRVPIVHGITDLPGSIALIRDAMQECAVSKIELLPFNPDTHHYYEALGMQCALGSEAIPSRDQLQTVKDCFERHNIKASIVG